MKERLDVILVKRGLAASREKAKEMIKAGSVYINGRREDKAGAFFDEDITEPEVTGGELRYVSRGGLKLEKALDCWKIQLKGKVCMDIGASTGGFTDCMLQNGAARVYAVDTGRGQLAEKLRQDERVICMEQTNFRYVTGDDIGERMDFAGADVSFISLTKILIPARNLLKSGGGLVCLIKPQFEAGRGRVGKNGVVREPEIHREVIRKIVDYADCIGFLVRSLEYSPVRGSEGNIEYLLYLKKEAEPEEAVASLSDGEAEKLLEKLTAEKTGLSHTGEWRERIENTVRDSHRNGGGK